MARILSFIAMTSQHTKYPKGWAQIHGVPASLAAHSVHYRKACQWWVFSLPGVASHLELARPLSSLQTWTWTLSWIKSPAEMKACVIDVWPFWRMAAGKGWTVGLACKQFEQSLAVKTAKYNLPELFWTVWRHWSRVTSASVADTSVKILSLLIWNLCPLDASYNCIHTELADMP